MAGITLGSVYALIALGYSMVYGILKLLNFAHGDVYMIGAFIGYGVLTALGGAARLSMPIAARCSSLMFIGAMLGGGLLGVGIERFAYRPLRDAPRIAPLITRARRLVLPRRTRALLLLRRRVPQLRHVRAGTAPLGAGLHAAGRRARLRSRSIIVVVGAVVADGAR